MAAATTGSKYRSKKSSYDSRFHPPDVDEERFIPIGKRYMESTCSYKTIAIVDKYPLSFDNCESKTLAPADRITRLPNSILLHILNLLPLHEAIRTTFLSKHWHHLWSHLPSLFFDSRCFFRTLKFFFFVEQVLLFSTSDVIDNFSLDLGYDDRQMRRVHSWLRFALDRNVRHLHLLFDKSILSYYPSKSFNLPDFLYMNGTTITCMNLLHCSFVSCNDKINWTCLRRLSLTRCSLTNDFLSKLWSGCPVLEFLELVRCEGWNKVDITSLALKEFVIKGYNLHQDNDDVITILAPYLQTLVISGYLYTKCRVENVSSLVEATLNFHCHCFHQHDQRITKVKTMVTEAKTMVADILGRMNHVNKLSLGIFFLQVLSLHSCNPFPYPFSICTSLRLDGNLEKGGLWGLAHMLQNCPELEILVIHLQSSTTALRAFEIPSTMKNFLALHHRGFSCMQHLKLVKIFGLIPGCTQTQLVEFLQFLFNHAKVLKKLSVNTSRCSQGISANDDISSSMAETLLNFRRSSPSVEIQLNY